SEHLSRQLDKQQPAQDNSCLAPIFLKSEPTPSAPKNPLGARSCHWPTFGHTNFDAQNVGQSCVCLFFILENMIVKNVVK
ncbi:unnamed protein product, partial [Tenebrio molitor]